MWAASKLASLRVVVGLALIQATAFAANVDPTVLDSCPGYNAVNVKSKSSGLTADLTLASTGCNLYGKDIQELSLKVVYETEDRIHVKITDPSRKRYEVPESVFPRPENENANSKDANIAFNYTTSPFSFSIYRKSTKEVLFSTASHAIIFEPQYLRVKTNLPANPNIYGLGEHTQTFHLPTDNTTLTLWSRDAYGIPVGTNLYGNHPVYFEHRTTGTHAVFLLNSNGMDIKLNTTNGASTLEYNAIGGVLDFYFLAGSENDPTEVAKQYAEIVGLPAEVPYWSFGLHQCRFGYQNFVDVANVIVKYAAAKIPLETMWTDIDYMDRRRIFTVDPKYFPMPRMREIVSYLHAHQQKFILMTDPAVPYLPSADYAPYEHGHALDVFLKAGNGSESLGVVWPGVTVYPDWFHPKIAQWWNSEFANFYSPSTGLDIDGAWIDMNEPANFCNLPCDDPFQQAVEQNMPPPRTSSPPDPNTPIFTNSSGQVGRRDDFLNPPYAINNAAGALSSKTAFTNVVHANGLVEYDTHNLYGTMMSVATRDAMLARRPGKKTLIITRSTFAGAGAHVGKWLGDNMSKWEHYRVSIAGMLAFASIYQVPMVGSDICGFADNTTETLCARWASLGAFYPFMRNHNADTSISQEFYLWPSVADSARNAIDIRYRLIDYLYTAFHQAHLDGTPVLHPLWYKYPKDANTFPIDLQFFFGDSVLVSPVTEENSTSVAIYLPKDTFYDFNTLAPVQGAGAKITLDNVNFTQIPVHIKSGVVLPLRVRSQMTTTELRKTDFELVVAQDANGNATGHLYVDDGDSIEQKATTTVDFKFSKNKLTVSGKFGYNLGVKVARVRFLNVQAAPKQAVQDGKVCQSSYDAKNKVFDVTLDRPFNQGFVVQI
ncbi:alpha-glucosidase [Crepidotus variabilis]|uniref:beta-glucosidase n=1 Tax=Crepidotus variabilis TaxID=179855 RepID=A0A9P6EFY4_9AGAR|nr:alpha-glucosidase [Crepidotus variabilis]